MEYYDSRLDDFREEMRERIFCKKRNDGQRTEKGQRKKKTHSQVGKDMNQLSEENNQKVNEIIDCAESYNIHPIELFKLNDSNLFFYPFGELNTTSECKALSGNENECYEKSFLDKLIRRWFEGNGKDYPQDDSNIEFFYNYDLFFVLDGFIEQKKDTITNYTEYMRKYDYFIIKAKIHTYRNNIKSDVQNFNLLIENFIAHTEFYKIRNAELQEESTFSDRGSIYVDWKNPPFIYKLNMQDIYEFASIHFWEIYDEFILLQANQPDLFGKGAEPILRELHKIFSGKNEKYWGSFEEFKLKIQQQYLYTANEKQGLRLDLYRNIFDDGDFQGGIWHSFKHFKSNGKTMSAKSEGGKNYNKNNFFNMLKEAFFVKTWSKDKKDRLNVSIPYSTTEGKYTFGFHEDKCLDSENNVISTLYSLNTTSYTP